MRYRMRYAFIMAMLLTATLVLGNATTTVADDNTGRSFTGTTGSALAGGYANSAVPKVRVTRTTVAGITTVSEFDDWATAVAEIDNAADRTSKYEIALLADLGGDTAEAPPMKSLDMPKNAAEVRIVSVNTGPSNHGILITASDKVTFNCPTILKGVGIVCLKRQKNGSYVSGDYDLNIGGNKVVIDDLKHTYNGKKSGVNNITGTKEGSVRFIMGDATLRIGGNTTGVGTVEIINPTAIERGVHAFGRLAPGNIVAEGTNGSILIHTNSDLTVTSLKTEHCRISSGKAMNIVNLDADGSILYVGNATGHPNGVDQGTPATADLNVTNAILRNNTHVYAQNVNVKEKLTTEGSVLDAGYKLTRPGQGGKVSIARLFVVNDNWIFAKQDLNGRSQITVNGTVNADPGEAEVNGLERICLWNNDYSGLAQVYDGMVLATAPKAEPFRFMPVVVDASNPGVEHYMGIYDPNRQGTYKSGNKICFGLTEDRAE